MFFYNETVSRPIKKNAQGVLKNSPPSRGGGGATKVQLAVLCGIGGSEIHAKWVRTQLRKALHELGLTRGEVSVILANDRLMAELHQRFSSIAGTTDVLTFDLGTKKKGTDPFIQGEVYVCVDEAKRRAAELGHPVRHELLLYALHGLLHLLGYDDHTTRDYRAMHNEEDRVLQAIGIGAVFKPSRHSRKK